MSTTFMYDISMFTLLMSGSVAHVIRELYAQCCTRTLPREFTASQVMRQEFSRVEELILMVTTGKASRFSNFALRTD